MRNILQSKIVAWVAMAVVVIVIVATFSLRPAWWAFIDLFFAFMMVFCQLVSVYFLKLNLYVAKKLRIIAAICGLLMVISLIGEYIVYAILYK